MGLIRWELEPLRTIAFGSVSNSFSQIGGDFEFPLRMIALYSNLDADTILSFDGVTDQWFFPSKGSFILDVGANATDEDEMYIAQGKGVWIRHLGVAPTVGAAYVVAMYGFSR